MSLIGIIASSKLGIEPPSTVDYLVVAGGGGGGRPASVTFGGGGGAGGFRTATSFSLPSSFTVTVGGGGAI